jgi:hypothetical protein
VAQRGSANALEPLRGGAPNVEWNLLEGDPQRSSLRS